jgi:hypothetical protein
MNTRLNKKVKKDLDAYFKGFKGSDPEVHHGVKHILIGALTDANFHSEAKRVANMFPKANQSKYAGRKDWEASIEQNHGVPIAKAAKWDGHDIIDAISFFVSMFIGGPVGAKVSSLKEGMNENLKMFVTKFIKEVTHSYEYEDMSNEDENDKEEIKIGEYQTKYFHVCPGASSLYGDIESKGVDMDMAERSVRLQDALFFIEEHVGGEGYTPDKDYIMVAKNIAKNIMKMGKMMGLEKEHSYIQGHVDTIIKSVEGKKLEEKVIELTEKNVPTDPAKWAASKAAAKRKFDVYPSAYANAWAAKNYKGKGGGWRTKKESIEEAYIVLHSPKKGVKPVSTAAYADRKDAEKWAKDLGGITMIVKKKIKGIDESIKEGVMSDLHLLINKSKSEQEFVKTFFKNYGKQVKKTPDSVEWAKELYSDMKNESVNEGISVFDERHFGKKGIIIMIDDNGKKVSAIFKNKKNADKYNRNKSSDLQTLLKLAKNTPYPKAIDESVNEAKEPEVITTLRKIVKNKQNDLIKDTKSGKKVRVDMNSANLMVQVYDALKQQSNKDKFVKSGIVNMGHMAYKLMKKENTSEVIEEAEYQGRKVELSKIMQGDVKKFKVYVKNDKGNVVKVNFGQKGMSIKKSNPGARKSFRARMNCDNPGPRWKARYWSCRKW